MEQEHPVRVGRRLAAIVAADVAGYSRLMGLDEVGTARTLLGTMIVTRLFDHFISSTQRRLRSF